VIVGLGRPGSLDLLAGLDHLVDDVIEADGRSAVGPAKVASRLRAMKLDAALILPNSFSSATAVRLAGIDIRVGYNRDGRGFLLTHDLEAVKRTSPPWGQAHGYEPISAVNYYLQATRRCIDALESLERLTRSAEPEPPVAMTLATTRAQDQLGDEILAKAKIGHDEPFALLNPGGNNPAKRWPVERFAAVAHHLITRHRMRVAINGAPAEKDLCNLIANAITLNHPEDESMVACLPELGGTIGSLKRLTSRARVMVTNDTGPRHIAAAFGVPCVTLFGPTDPRWTTLPPAFTAPGVPREVTLVADPTLPASEVADDHPERCRIDRIATETVIEAVDEVLRGVGGGGGVGGGQGA
jgi:heptosyltransferase-2